MKQVKGVVSERSWVLHRKVKSIVHSKGYINVKLVLGENNRQQTDCFITNTFVCSLKSEFSFVHVSDTYSWPELTSFGSWRFSCSLNCGQNWADRITAFTGKGWPDSIPPFGSSLPAILRELISKKVKKLSHLPPCIFMLCALTLL